MRLILSNTNTYLRPINLSDVNEDYLSWFYDPYVLKYISFASTSPTLESLSQYVQSKISSSDCLFLGIFDLFTDRIIGTIKFDPIDRVLGSAELGILIGLPEFRGRGIASEALNTSISYVRSHLQLHSLTLGVCKTNFSAINLYTKLGFVVHSTAFFSHRMILVL